jgi:alkanesulfonate monooxygenase SsuD/methylene tetrahydromethanopterin reductase-like flavin-dependent oxidoreductase (luciferase family)
MATPEEFQEASDKISRIAKDTFGRNPKEIRRSIEFFVTLDQDRDRAKKLATQTLEGYFANPVDEETIRRFSIFGTVEDCVDQLEQFFEAGADTVVLVIGLKDQVSQVKELGKSVLSCF